MRPLVNLLVHSDTRRPAAATSFRMGLFSAAARVSPRAQRDGLLDVGGDQA
jgi:hypothetical protein